MVGAFQCEAIEVEGRVARKPWCSLVALVGDAGDRGLDLRSRPRRVVYTCILYKTFRLLIRLVTSIGGGQERFPRPSWINIYGLGRVAAKPDLNRLPGTIGAVRLARE